MVREKQAFLRNLFVIIDGVVIVLAFALAYFISYELRQVYNLGEMAFAIAPNLKGLFYFVRKNFVLVGFYLPLWLISLASQGAYKDFRTKTFFKTLMTIVVAGGLTALALGTPIFLFKMDLTSRLFIGIMWVLTVVLLLFARQLLNLLLDYVHALGYNQVNLLIVGTGWRAREFIQVVKSHANWGLRIVGLIDDDHDMFGREIEGYRVLGRIQDIPFVIHRKVIDRVIFVVPRLWLNRIDDAILACEREGIPTSISMDLYNLNIAKVRQTNFSGFPLLEFETFAAKEWQLFAKHAIDILLARAFHVALLAVAAVSGAGGQADFARSGAIQATALWPERADFHAV
jgi:FlaA1/EpsC-like NDP-sugar epimerase